MLLMTLMMVRMMLNMVYSDSATVMTFFGCAIGLQNAISSWPVVRLFGTACCILLKSKKR